MMRPYTIRDVISGGAGDAPEAPVELPLADLLALWMMSGTGDLESDDTGNGHDMTVSASGTNMKHVASGPPMSAHYRVPGLSNADDDVLELAADSDGATPFPDLDFGESWCVFFWYKNIDTGNNGTLTLYFDLNPSGYTGLVGYNFQNLDGSNTDWHLVVIQYDSASHALQSSLDGGLLMDTGIAVGSTALDHFVFDPYGIDGGYGPDEVNHYALSMTGFTDRPLTQGEINWLWNDGDGNVPA